MSDLHDHFKETGNKFSNQIGICRAGNQVTHVTLVYVYHASTTSHSASFIFKNDNVEQKECLFLPIEEFHISG